jgi:hypothetical protein
VAGPPVAGVLIVAVGLPATYGVDVATFLVSLIALALMRAVPPPPDSEGLSLSPDPPKNRAFLGPGPA